MRPEHEVREMTPDQTEPCADGGYDCEAALRELYVYLDGHLTIERRTTIKAHIDMCSPCFSAFSFETDLRQVVSLRCADEVPEALRLKIADALRGEIEGGPFG